MKTVTQTMSEPTFRRRVEEALRQAPGPLTLGDVVASTGLPTEQTENLLLDLLDEYRGALSVDTHGHLIYRFPHGLQKPQTWKEQLRRFGRWLTDAGYRFLKVAFKVWIMLMLVVYFILYVVIAIAILIAILRGSSDSDSSSSSDDGGGLFDFLFWWWWMDDWSYRRRRRRWGWDSGERGQSRSGGARGSHRKERGRPLWERIFAFVFGEEEPKADRLAREKEVLAYLRDHSGRLTVADLISLFGISVQEAEEYATRLMIDYDGDVEVSEDGSLIYSFDRIMPSLLAGQVTIHRRHATLGLLQQVGWRRWWDKMEHPKRFDHNPPGSDGWFIFFNAFNLLWSGAFTFSPASMAALLGIKSAALIGPLAIGLGWVPFAFSVLFFLIPLLRWFQLQKENSARRGRNQERAVARSLFELAVESPVAVPIYPESADATLRQVRSLAPDTALTPSWVERFRQRWEAFANQAGDLVSRQSWLERFRKAWDGEVENDEEGGLYYDFSRLQKEWRDVQAARSRVRPEESRIGPIEYSSENGIDGC